MAEPVEIKNAAGEVVGLLNVPPGATPEQIQAASQQFLAQQQDAAPTSNLPPASQRGEEPELVPPTMGDVVRANTQGPLGALAQTGLALGTGMLAQVTGLGAGLSAPMQEDSVKAMEAFDQAVQALTFRPNNPAAMETIQEIGELTAPLAELMDFVADADDGDPFLAEWIKTGFALTGPLRRARRPSARMEKLTDEMIAAEESGYRVTIGERRGHDTLARQTATRMGGVDNVNSRITHHNQNRSNTVVAKMLDLPVPSRGIVSLSQGAMDGKIAQARVPIGQRIASLDEQIAATPGAKPRAWMTSLRTVYNDSGKIMQGEGTVATLSRLRTNADRVMAQAPASVRAELQPQLAQVMNSSAVRQFTNGAGDIDVPTLSRWVRPGRDIWIDPALTPMIRLGRTFPGSARLATEVKRPTGGASIFDLMLSPAIVATIGVGAQFGTGPAVAAGTVAGGLALMSALKRLGSRYGFGSVSGRVPSTISPARRTGQQVGLEGIVEGTDTLQELQPDAQN